MPPSDAELARDALGGSEAAYRELVTRYATPAVNFVFRFVRDRALAEDLAQEGFLRVYQRLSTYDPERKFSSWFFQVLRNITIDHLRVNRLPTASLTALSRIRPEYREVVVLRYQEGLTHPEIAEILGMPSGTVKTYLHRARKELAGILSEQGWGPASVDGIAGQD